MKITRAIEEYILENKLEIKVQLNLVDIVNYKDIGHFDSNKVVIKHDKGQINILGEKLVVSKLLNKEVLITGVIKDIELR